MTPTFLGINTALSGLEAQQLAMDVTGHNIANASTPGYSRQQVGMATTDPLLMTGVAGELGTGVTVGSITRAHSDFVQQQITYQNGQQSQQQAMSDALSQVSQLFNDPSDHGFSSLLSAFFTSWQQLANNPADASMRAAVVSSGANLASGFNSLSTSLQQMQQQQDQQVGGLVQQVNTLVGQIATVNQQIIGVAAQQQTPNDLEDKRDTLVNQLSSLIDVSTTTAPNGTITISLQGGGALVQGISSFSLATIADPRHPGFSAVTFAGQQTPVAISGGQLGGVLAVRDSVLGGQLSALDTLAGNVIGAVNNIQSAGYGSNGATGIAFFTGTTSGTIAVNPTLVADPSNVAASAVANEPGDGSNALKMAQLQETPPAGGTVTLQQQYSMMVSQLGANAQQAQSNVQTGSLVLQQLGAQQASVSSVSLNEEAANLIQYQTAYEAAGRVISIMSQSINDLIAQM